MGPPGSGKGTVSERIVKKFGFQYLASGDLLRNQVKEKTELGIEAKSYIDKGALVPDELVQKLVLNELHKANQSDWLLDGYPRTVAQAENLAGNFELTCAINLEVPIEVIVERISKRWLHLPSGRIYNTDFNPPQKPGLDDLTGEPLVQRPDDKPDVVKKRLETYFQKTKPVLDFYRKTGILQEFKGRETNEIWPHVKQFLSEYKK